MPDGTTDFSEHQSQQIVDVVALAMDQRSAFNALRRIVRDAVRAQGGQVIATDRIDGTIIVAYTTTDGQRHELVVVETHEYRIHVPVSDW